MKRYLRLIRVSRYYLSKDRPKDSLINPKQSDLSTQINQQVNLKVSEKLEESKNLLAEFDLDTITQQMDEIDKPVEIEVSKAYSHLFMDNPLQQGDYIMTNEESIQSNEEMSLRVKNNEFGKEVLTTGQFDIADTRVELRNNATSSLFLDKESDFKTFSLGPTQTMQKDSVYIDDIDVDKIPAHLNIELTKYEKEMVVVGKLIGADETEEESRNGKETIDKEIFNEKSYKEMFQHAYNGFEKFIIYNFDFRLFKWSIRWAPLFVFMLALMSTISEERDCYASVHKIEDDKMMYLNKLKYGKVLD